MVFVPRSHAQGDLVSVKTFNPHTELLPVAPLAYRAVSLDRNQIYFSEVC